MYRRLKRLVIWWIMGGRERYVILRMEVPGSDLESEGQSEETID